MPETTPDGAVHVIARSPRSMKFRLNATQIKVAGIGLAALTQMWPQIITQYPGLKSAGLWLAFAGLCWDMGMKKQDAQNLAPVPIAPPNS